MLKQPIEFIDPFSDEENPEKLTETFYFNITTPELIEMNFSEKDGLQGFLQQILDEEDGAKILEFFKQFILMGLGDRDGVLHIKSQACKDRFLAHPAWPVLYTKMFDSPDFAADFIIGCMPPDLVKKYTDEHGDLKTAIIQDKPAPGTRPTLSTDTPPPIPTDA